ncbi:hypothetical protein M011DRAFT_60675 [Sporormia fimetaria CBS 119925]|uniref:Uncharacterized protein n=1 Tax=Sporormia fimetaria CBS 119925 TaxID=1340428 RepID=A0A6A6V947_9PLEO|nr:hypothetical protein M011DRAFT_60675 [Sporormia fimetaria CBS 119925]
MSTRHCHCIRPSRLLIAPFRAVAYTFETTLAACSDLWLSICCLPRDSSARNRSRPNMPDSSTSAAERETWVSGVMEDRRRDHSMDFLERDLGDLEFGREHWREERGTMRKEAKPDLGVFEWERERLVHGSCECGRVPRGLRSGCEGMCRLSLCGWFSCISLWFYMLQGDFSFLLFCGCGRDED